MTNEKYFDHIGNMVKELRKEKGLSQSELCRGLCSRYTLDRIEEGYCSSEKILIDAIFQRIGISVNKFEVSYPNVEYEAVSLRQLILHALLKKEYKMTRIMLKKYEKCNKSSATKTLYQQFIYLCNIIINNQTDPKNDMENQIRKALMLTKLDLSQKKAYHYLMHDEEILLLVMLSDTLYQHRNKQESKKILYDLLNYIDKNIVDKEEYARLFPIVSFVLSKKLLKEKRYDELCICEKAINSIKENHNILIMQELLKVQLDGWKKSKDSRYIEHKVKYQMFFEAVKSLGVKWYHNENDILLLSNMTAQGHIIGNQIQMFRKMLGLKQVDFNDACQTGSLSRIEGGRKPTEKHYKEIMEIIGREGRRYQTIINSNMYSLHIARYQFFIYMENGKHDEANEQLQVLEKGLNHLEPINYQFLLKSRALVDFNMGLIEARLLLEKLIESICVTLPRKLINQVEKMEYISSPKKKAFDVRFSEFSKVTEHSKKKLKYLIKLLENWPLTCTETHIWNNIANVVGELNDKEVKIHILSMIKNNYEKSDISLLHNSKGYLPTICNLANEQVEIGLITEAIANCDKGIKISMSVNQSNVLLNLLCLKAVCLGLLNENKAACFRLFKQAYSLAYVLGFKTVCQKIIVYCKEKLYNGISEYQCSTSISSQILNNEIYVGSDLVCD